VQALWIFRSPLCPASSGAARLEYYAAACNNHKNNAAPRADTAGNTRKNYKYPEPDFITPLSRGVQSMMARVLTFITCLGLSAVLFAQTGHPAKGSWSGLLTSGSDTTRIRLLINAHNGELSGSINPGRNAIEMDSIELDASDWGLQIEATMPEGELVLDGTLSNLGSWTNRKFIGTYTLGSTRGNFEITLN